MIVIQIYEFLILVDSVIPLGVGVESLSDMSGSVPGRTVGGLRFAKYFPSQLTVSQFSGGAGGPGRGRTAQLAGGTAVQQRSSQLSAQSRQQHTPIPT